jgi:hypothetical protein
MAGVGARMHREVLPACAGFLELYVRGHPEEYVPG